MTTLTVHPGSLIGTRAPADPYRFNPIRELHRAGTKVITREDCEWFQWQPRSDIIVVCADMHPLATRAAVTLALAHRALGHWGNSLRQDLEARDLAGRWLIPDHDTEWARGAIPQLGAEEVAALLRVRMIHLRIRLGTICRCLANLDVHRGGTCECAGEVAA